jgi:hypothetical protein
MLSANDASIIKGMLARGDKQHDIAAFYGENGGRIAEISGGKKFADVKPAAADQLPKLTKAPPRYIYPKSPLDQQIEQLKALMRDPPENGRWVVFTPKLSDWILATLNNRNRRKRPRNIKRFAAAMAAGDWTKTGDTIKFSTEGTLLDGQNRFSASVLSGKSFTTLTVFGISDEAFAKIDTNALRTNADTMEIVGVPHSRIIAAAVRWLMIGQERGRSVTNTELHDYYREHVDAEEIQLAARRAIEVGRLLPPGSLTFLLYQFERKSKRTTEAFALDLAKQIRGGRKLLNVIETLRKQRLGRVHELEYQARIILCWNMYRRSEPVTTAALRWNEAKDEFPTIA